MNKQAAINLIADTFNSSFNENRFRHFIRNLFNEFDENKNASWITGYIKDSFKNHVKKYKRVGKYKDIDGNKLDVVVVHLRKKSALDSARTMQRNFIASYLKTRGEKDAAVVAYFTDNTDDWRFSYIRMEYRQEITESGKIKVKEEFTPRRYSFLVGKNEPNHTAQQQLFPILCDDKNNPPLSELEKAFSVESVTKKFYQDYKGLFSKLTDELNRIIEEDSKIKKEFNDKNIDTANFAKKLLGQIVFLYFLQKKGWLGVGKDVKGDFKSWGTGPKNFLRQIHEKKYIRYNNFFNDVLEPLFYEALATERLGDYYSRFNCKIPFLNGGLFEPIGEYNWQETDILINNDLFSKIFKTFDQYNFTVREDEPLEKEVAVDPEMLGKVFENLLPENLRKGQGAYYTPREIVHYMCQESLINYLDTAVNTGKISLIQEKPVQKKLFGTSKPKQLGLRTTGYKSVIPKQDIEDFIRKGEFAIEHDIAKEEGTKSYKYQVPKSIRQNAKPLDDKLAEIKICDPAIGSGAFPVGMMHEIIKGRNVLTTYLEDKTKRSIYEFKRNCIQQSLYGVDIDPGAIDIAKLRLWLSLIVDEDDYRNIKPLPNLDYKIMQGNSLIEEFHGISLNIEKENKSEKPFNMQLFNDNKDLDKLIENLHNKQDKLFLATHPEEKRLLKRKVEDAVVEIFHYELQRSNEEYFREIRAIEDKVEIIPKEKDKKEYYDKEKAKLDKRYKFDFAAVENELREMTRGNKERNFFPWKLYFADVFQKNGGFDVVIANPPYLEARSPEFSDNMKNGIQLAVKNRWGNDANLIPRGSDLLIYFFELSIYIVNTKGYIVFITQNAWLNTEYGKKFQGFLLKHTQVKNIIDSDFKYFNSKEGPNINTVISIFHSDTYSSDNVLTFARYHENFEKVFISLSKIEDASSSVVESVNYKYSDKTLSKYKWGMLYEMDSTFITLLSAIEKKGCHIQNIPNMKLSVGQGLNLSKKHLVDLNTIKKYTFLSKAIIPLMTADDDAPFNLKNTNKFIVNKTKVNKKEQKILKSLSISLFNPLSTRKIVPVLIMPRGIGRHFCTVNTVSAYSASCVDIYDYSPRTERKTLLNLWVFLNSSVGWLIREISGRKNLGGGMLKAEAVDLKFFPIYFDLPNIAEIKIIFRELGNRSALEPLCEIETAEHKKIDNIIFEYLNIHKDKRKNIINLLKLKISEREKKSKT